MSSSRFDLEKVSQNIWVILGSYRTKEGDGGKGNGTKGWQSLGGWVILSLGSLENSKDTFRDLDKWGSHSYPT